MKRHQHTAPVSYLRGFVDDRSMLSIRRRSGTQLEIGVRDAAVRRNFYTFRDSAGLNDAVETWFADNVETPIGPVFARLRDGDVVRAEDVEVLTLFIAAQVLRTATARAYMEQIDSHLGPWILCAEIVKKNGIRWDRLSDQEQQTYLSAARHVLVEHHDSDQVRISQLKTMAHEIGRTHDRLFTWGWRVLTADRPRLITGDAPVATIQPTRFGFSGLIPSGSPVFLPLSPTQLLIGTDGRPFEFDEASRGLAQTVNQRIADQAADTLVKATWQGWPRKVRYGRESPRLRPPTITTTSGERTTSRRSEPLNVSQPYPAVRSASLRNLIERLGGMDQVE